jgi:tetratricopeptide (TPR) repeat protein
VAMTVEDFARAAGLYDETLDVYPQSVDALLGKVRALTYESRHLEAIATTDRLLATRWNMGEARYWRALNEATIERYDAAWLDVEEAAKLLINADVPKLAGIIAYRRKQLDVSRAKFEESRSRYALDCETNFYLGTVLAELRVWEASATILEETVACIDRAETALLEDIARIRASRENPDRQARQIARREVQLANGRRTRITSWFDLAVDYFSLGRSGEARAYAEKVKDDEQFGVRAQEILSRTPAGLR